MIKLKIDGITWSRLKPSIKFPLWPFCLKNNFMSEYDVLRNILSGMRSADLLEAISEANGGGPDYQKWMPETAYSDLAGSLQTFIDFAKEHNASGLINDALSRE